MTTFHDYNRSPMAVLSDKCILALQAATAAACVEALKAAPPGDLWSHVLAIVNPAIQLQARKHMERVSCIARLPNELLLAIFEYLPFWDRVRAATVCHSWRKISLRAVSALWSDIPHLENVDTYETLLARAGTLPVMITYNPEDLEYLESFCDIISRNIGRVKSLRLILPVPCDHQESLEAAGHLGCVLRDQGPILESLIVSDSGIMLYRPDNSLTILKSPMLRTAQLEHIHLSSLDACVGSRSLRTLSISTSETYFKLIQGDLSYIARLPALESLSLRLPDVFAVDVPGHRHSLPSSLQHLYLEVYPSLLDTVANVEDLSRFQTVHISFLRWHAEHRQLADVMPFLGDTTISAAVHFNPIHFCLLAADRTGRKTVLWQIGLRDDWNIVLPHAKQLWLGEKHPFLRHPRGNAAVVFPALEELTLDATDTPSHPGCDRRPPVWASISCPRLRVVRFISENARPALPAREVLRYLRSILASSARTPRRLDSLIFDGVTVSPAPGADLATIAENVEMLQSGEIPPESYRVWADTWGKRSDF